MTAPNATTAIAAMLDEAAFNEDQCFFRDNLTATSAPASPRRKRSRTV